MKILILCIIVICSIFFSSCSKNITITQNKSFEQIATDYTVIKDICCAADSLQTMDIYLAKDVNSLGRHDYTVVFLHGGGYYFSDKSQEERYIEPYQKKASTWSI
jgi:acetyl esterase/lipase